MPLCIQEYFVRKRTRIPPSGLSRRSLFLTVAASSLVAACGGGGNSSGGSGGSSLSSSSSSSSSSRSSSASSGPVLPDPATAPALKTHFAGKFKVGLVSDEWITSNASISTLVIRHASSMTAENVLKADPIAVGGEGVYDFSRADILAGFCASNGIPLRGTPLVWHATTPSWFFDGDPADAGYKATVRARLERYVTDVVTHYKGQIYAWDVVNEVISDDGSQTYRDSQWYQVLGKDFIAYAFNAARAADPAALLFINDYLTEDAGKLARLMSVVDDLVASHVPIDGVGHQLHVNIDIDPAAVEAALAATEARGLINHVTELDVSVYTSGSQAELSGAPLAAALQSQALKYRALFNLFVAHPSVEVVTIWGTDDAHTWLDTFPVTRNDYPLLFDDNANPKSAFWAVVDPTFVP